MPKFYSELQNASLENLASDPTPGVAGRIIRNTTDGKVKVDNGTAFKSALLNDDKAVIGTNATASNNVRLHRGASEVLQFVPGDNATAEGTLATTLAQTSSQVENYTTGALPTFGNAGRMLWDTTTTQLKVDTGSAIKVIGPSPTTTKGDIIANNGTDDIRLAVGTNGQFLKADSGQTSGLIWGSGAANLAYRSVVTTDTATNADDILELSGASFTQTLFTAVGNTGKVIEIVHAGTSLSQVYTLATTGGQTIGGIASGSYALYTNGEKLTIYSDGTNWKIKGHDTKTAWVAYTPTGAMTTGATYTGFWRRVGDSMQVMSQISFSGGTDAVTLTMLLPTNSAIDTAKVLTTTATKGNFGLAAHDSAGLMHVGTVSYSSTTAMQAMGDDGVGSWSNTIPAGVGSGTIVSFNYTVPISGWRP